MSVVTLKRWKLAAGYAILQPGNLRYTPLVSRDVRVIGKLVGTASAREVEE